VIYFVGIHNKPGMAALDSRTYTGKIIDQIISKVGPAVKTNFVDMDTLPKSTIQHAVVWNRIYRPAPGDTVVLLGRFVQKRFIRHSGVRYIEVDHPSAFRVRADVAGYVARVSEQCVSKD
jgi:hypothetical protein